MSFLVILSYLPPLPVHLFLSTYVYLTINLIHDRWQIHEIAGTAAFRRVGLVMPVADCESVFRYPATCTLSIHGQGVCIISSTASGAPRLPYSSNPILWSAYSSFGRAIGDGLDVPAADKEL